MIFYQKRNVNLQVFILNVVKSGTLNLNKHDAIKIGYQSPYTAMSFSQQG